MSELPVEYATKLTALLLIGLVITCSKRHLSAELRAHVTFVVLLGALCLPLAILVLPNVDLGTTMSSNLPVTTMLPLLTSQVAAGPVNDVAVVGGGVWLLLMAIGTFLLIALAAVQWILSYRLVGRLRPIDDSHLDRQLSRLQSDMGITARVALREQNLARSPFTWGLRRHVIALPMDFRQWNTSRQRAALVHELAHVKRRDCIVMLIAKCAWACCWWHPLAWIALGRLRKDVERACDDVVVDLGAEPADYAEHLIDVARGGDFARPHVTLSMARAASLKSRVRALLNQRQRRTRMSKQLRQFVWGLTAVMVSAVGAIQVGAQLPDDQKYLPLFKAQPVYPREAQEQGIEGYVVVEFDIDEYGKTFHLRAVEQEPGNGIFEQAAIEAAANFRYLPERDGGVAIVKTGIRNRISFVLGDDGEVAERELGELGELAVLSKTNSDAKRKLTQRLHNDIEVAEAQENGDRFVQLANYAMQVEPSTAEYLVVRASQLGTSEPDLLRIVGGKVLYHRGAYAEAIALFESVSDADLAKKRVALEWINYLERESARRDVIHNTLLELQR